MKILFIFKNENFMVPLGICFISALARRDGHEVYLSEMHSEDPLERIARLKPDMVAYSSATGEAKHYLSVNRVIKEKFPQVFALMGGPHPTFFPEMIQDTTLDAVCVGEGDDAFLELLRALSQGKSIEGIPNIHTRNSQQLTLRHLIEDLDSLPHPDYALLYDNTALGSYPLKSFMTSRGCPHQCSYCFNHAWNKLYEGKGKVVRRFSVDYCIEDIERVMARWPLSSIKFYDDIFCYAADAWLEEFSRKYKQRINLPFFIFSRANLLNEEMVKLLKFAGCRTISMSIEAGNPRVRNELLKRNMSDEQLINAHTLCGKYGIRTFTNCILALPHTTIRNDIESVELAVRCKVDWAEFSIFYPYPKTELGDTCIRENLYVPDYSRMHTSCMSVSPLNCFSRKEKNIQQNLSALGSVVVVFPWIKHAVIRYLIYLPSNRLYTLMYYLVKMYVMRKKIYVTRTSFGNSLRIFLRSLRQELFRRQEKDVVKI